MTKDLLPCRISLFAMLVLSSFLLIPLANAETMVSFTCGELSGHAAYSDREGFVIDHLLPGGGFDIVISYGDDPSASVFISDRAGRRNVAQDGGKTFIFETGRNTLIMVLYPGVVETYQLATEEQGSGARLIWTSNRARGIAPKGSVMRGKCSVSASW